MRIGVDAIPLQKIHGGVSYYVFFLLDELIQLRPLDSFFLFVNQKTKDLDYFRRYTNVEIVLVFPSFLGHSIWAQTSLSYACWNKKIDLFWGATQSIPLFKKKSMKTLFTLHDFVYLLCPETMTIYKKFYLKVFTKWMLKGANAILPNSKGTADKLMELYKVKHTRVITPPLKPKVFFQEKTESFLQLQGLSYKNYLTTIGTLEPRKNFEELIQIFTSYLDKNPIDQILPLVIVGGGGWKNKKLLEVLSAAKEKYPAHIHLVGYRSDDEIAVFLSGARYCLMVSKYEGYGMPLAEARMCRTMNICLDQPEMREASENDGIFLNPQAWQNEIGRYFMRNAQIQAPKRVCYLSNREKAVMISEVIDAI